jgi:hypothetical protein
MELRPIRSYEINRQVAPMELRATRGTESIDRSLRWSYVEATPTEVNELNGHSIQDALTVHDDWLAGRV